MLQLKFSCCHMVQTSILVDDERKIATAAESHPAVAVAAKQLGKILGVSVDTRGWQV